MRYRPTWGYRDDIRAIQLQARLGSISCPIWWGAMWHCLEVFNTASNNVLRYYWTNWANWDVLQVAPVQMADTRAENGGHIVAIRDGGRQRGGAEGVSCIVCMCICVVRAKPGRA